MNTALADEVEITTEEPTVLYRFYALDGSLLYVGITGNLKARLAQHASAQPWWPEVSRKTAALYPSRAEALEAEATAIRAERPRHNVRGAFADTAATHPVRPQDQFIHGAHAGRCIWSEVLRGYINATQDDVRQWHERMVATGINRLGLILADGMDGAA